jgi:ATP-dependent RNA helicase MSS116
MSSNVGEILVLAPTRELALQIEEEAKTLLAHHPYSVQSVIGGTKCVFLSPNLNIY